MSTSSSTTTSTFQFGNTRTRKTTTIYYKNEPNEGWVEDTKTEVIEEWDEPVTYTPPPPAPAYPVPSYPPYPGYPTLPYVTYCANADVATDGLGHVLWEGTD